MFMSCLVVLINSYCQEYTNFIEEMCNNWFQWFFQLVDFDTQKYVFLSNNQLIGVIE